MDQPVTRLPQLAGLVGLTACCLMLAPALAAASSLADPTRPPAALAAANGDAVPAGSAVLQSVMLSPTRRVAIISGQAVALGESYQGARLVRLTESEAVLSRNDGTGSGQQVLKLYPDLHKQALSGRAASKPSPHSKTQK